MTVTNENGTLRVILTEAETAYYGIDEVFLGLDQQKAKAALKSLLRSAAVKAGFLPDALRFLIEIYPNICGGCEIFFIPSPISSGKRLRAKRREKRQERLVAELPDGEAVLSVCERLYTQGISTDSRLFKFNGRFRLVLLSSRETEDAVKEYTSFIWTSPTELAKTAEYGREICRGAVERIGLALEK